MQQTSIESRKLLLRRVVFFGYVAAVLGATLAPLSSDAYEAVSGLDKLVHVALFGGVAALLCWYVRSVSPQTATRVFLFTTAFALIVELVQGVLAYRSGDVWDLAAGSLGSVLGIGFAWAAARFWAGRDATSD